MVNTTGKYISNDTCEVVNISSDAAMLSMFLNDGKYSFVELCTCLSTITGNTYRELDNKAQSYAEENNMYDFAVIMVND